MRIPLTPFGRREIRICAVGFTVALAAIAFFAAKAGPAIGLFAIVPLAALAFTLQFFRDFDRDPGELPAGAVLSPADGRVVDIVEVEEPDFIGGKAVRVGIFMSPFDCHVNRFPVSGRVVRVVHRAGKFFAAYDPRAVAENESSTTGIAARFEGREVRIGVRQVAGIAARRIVNPLSLGAEAVRGARFGMIKFGSRCELFLPAALPFKLEARLGERVYAGLTVLAQYGTASAATAIAGEVGVAR
jgi:phosphatidylserine decarboxylase